ncbi:MAG: hypothetical protein ABSG65_04370 [Bryobacteraceae bacterium]|jgi:hypothetical protein
MCFGLIAIFDSDTMPRDRRAQLEAAVVASGRRLRHAGYFRAFEWNAIAPEVTERGARRDG